MMQSTLALQTPRYNGHPANTDCKFIGGRVLLLAIIGVFIHSIQLYLYKIFGA